MNIFPRKEILTDQQTELLSLVKKFKEEFILVGETAIALHLGHRRSIDFDLFSQEEFGNKKIRNAIIGEGWNIEMVFRDEKDCFTLLINGVQVTFFYYPFQIHAKEDFGEAKVPDLLTLGAMKAYALGRRAKWKDYVDLCFIFQKHGSVKPVIDEAKNIFKNEFNENLFRKQLAYFEDINYEEQVDFLSGFEVSKEEAKKKLTDFAIDA